LLAFRAPEPRTIERVAQEPVHRDFVIAIRVLDAVGMPYAELWRLMGPASARLGRPRPSYASVRRVAVEERRRALQRTAIATELFSDMVTGRLPYRFR
jgi:hypothetical protein